MAPAPGQLLVRPLVLLLLGFKVSIHLLALCRVHISKTLALGRSPWEVGMGKESGLTV